MKRLGVSIEQGPSLVDISRMAGGHAAEGACRKASDASRAGSHGSRGGETPSILAIP
jgi:hypothetical protein